MNVGAVYDRFCGAYAALQSAVLDPDLFKAIVAVAPVTDLETLRTEHNDFVDYRLVDAFIGHGEHVRSGSPAQNADRIKAPVLLFHGDLDQNVAVGESRLMESKLRAAGKQVRFVEYIFIDWLRNQRGSTAIMPYSVRARENAPVAAPISWADLQKIETAGAWTLHDADRLLRRAASPALAGWGLARQILPDV